MKDETPAVEQSSGVPLAFQERLLTDVIQAIPNPLYVIDAADYSVKLANSAASPRGDWIGKTCYVLTHHRDSPCTSAEHQCPLNEVKRTGRPVVVEHIHEDSQGNPRTVEVHGYPILDENGTVVQMVEVAVDITERKRAEEVIRRRAQEILEISTPVVQVWEGVLVATLIGALDSRRTQGLMETLLNRIVETGSSVALVDITAVPAIDTQTAQHLIETFSAVRLLGAQVILTGVRPAIAQALVHLGIDLSGVVTRSSLAAGLRVALDALDVQVTKGGSTA